MADYVDLESLPTGKAANDAVALGRNCAVFDHVRHLAYREIRNYWGNRNSFVIWQAWVYGACQQYNSATFSEPLSDREINHIARSIAKWVWREFSPKGFSEWQRAVGERGKEKAHLASQQVRSAQSALKAETALALRKQGLTNQQIAERLGVSLTQAKKYLKTFIPE